MSQTPKVFAQAALTRSWNANVYTAPANITTDLVTDFIISNNTKIDNPQPPTITQGGTVGSTSYTYYIVANDAWGAKTLVSSAGSTTSGNATLSASNYNIITWAPVMGAVSYDILKTNTTTALVTGTTGTVSGTNLTFNDTGQGTSAYTAPTSNTTGIRAYVTVHRVPNAGTLGLSNRVLSMYAIDAGTTQDVQINLPMVTGDSIQAKVNSGTNTDTAIDNNVVLMLTGVEFS